MFYLYTSAAYRYIFHLMLSALRVPSNPKPRAYIFFCKMRWGEYSALLAFSFPGIYIAIRCQTQYRIYK